MTPFDKALQFVLKYEGGIVDDPQDHGGLTKYGISQRAYPALDIRKLTQEDAARLYRMDYWEPCRCSELPSPLALITFDAAVNQGPSAARMMLQRALNVKVDGVIGDMTLQAARSMNLNAAVAEMIARRAVAYATLANVQRYGLGWFRRLAACHQTALEPL